MLGICFGHQILCDALGGRVMNNDRGWEVGSSNVYLTSSGRKSELFKGLGDTLSVYESHHDTVVDLPDEIDILADNFYGLQSFSYRNFIFGVQFHPEFSYDVMKAYYSARKEVLSDSSKYRVDHINDGFKVIDNFIDVNI